MGISSQRTPPKKRRERSIFGSIFNSTMLVVLVEVLLLVASIYLMRVGPQLNHNAEDILAMQVETRSGYIQSQLNDAQELSSLTSRINTLTQELLDSGAIDLATLDSSSDAAYPLLAAVTPKLISTLRSKPVTGIYLILNTHDLNERANGDWLPSVYLRDLDPDSPPPENNSDLMFERAPARLVQTQNIATDKAWKPAITYRSLGTGGCSTRRSRPPMTRKPSWMPLPTATGRPASTSSTAMTVRPSPTASPSSCRTAPFTAWWA